MIQKSIIIAEAGVNHNGDIDLAKRLIEVAASAGADYVKFQTFSAARLVTREVLKADYQSLATNTSESQYEMLRRLELSPSAYELLISHCNTCGIRFLSTGFDIESINFLNDLGQDRIKIPSGEITNLPYLRHIGQLGKPVILSTGMATLGEIETAIITLENMGLARSNLIVLHCTSEYPTPMAEVNLLAMQSIRKAFDVEIGYSDHTRGIEVSIAAIALGAKVIEKHFTINRSLPGPDHGASLEPAELVEMVRAIRNIEMALGDGIKRMTMSEARNRPLVRKSLVARCSIREGEIFNVDNVAIKRPGTGLSPMLWDDVMGRSATRNYEEDELIQL